MQIPKKQLDDSINGIVDFFQRNSKSATTKADFLKIQDTSIANLDGIYFLFLENLEIGSQITRSKLVIFDTKFDPQSQSDGACLLPAQSSEAIGQGGTINEQLNDIEQGYTITCADCHGTGIDKLDICACDNCRGTGREFIAISSHAKNCHCFDCLPYGTGDEPVLKIQRQAVIV